MNTTLCRFAAEAGLLMSFATLPSSATAQPQLPFTEDFVSDSANWRDAAGAAPLDWIAAGGPDGGSFARGSFNFVGSAPDDTPVILRGHATHGASGGAFAGNWIDAGVTALSAWVRHDTGVPLNFFTRVAGPANFPGAVAVESVPVVSGEWTRLSFAIDEHNPQFVTFEGSDFTTIFGDVANVQFGVTVPPELSGMNADFAFELDKVGIVPEPVTLTLFALGAAAFVGRRRW